jgi:hypothetical protein
VQKVGNPGALIEPQRFRTDASVLFPRAIGTFPMLVALNRVRRVEANSPAKRTGRLLNVIERALAVAAVGHHDVVGEAILTLYDEIPLPNFEG